MTNSKSQSTRNCEFCGDTFQTLTRLRLHECREEKIADALLPEPNASAVPNEPLSTETLDQVAALELVDEIETVLDISHDGSAVMSFLIKIDGRIYALHPKHDTGEWKIASTGTKFPPTKREHLNWISNDLKPRQNEYNPDHPPTITRECDHCGSEHELHRDHEPASMDIGLLGYNGYCDEAEEVLLEINPQEMKEALDLD